MRTPAWVWQTMGAMTAVSFIVLALTESSTWAALAQILVALLVGNLAVNRQVRHERSRRGHNGRG